METVFAQYNEANGNMVELVIANNDEMALGAIQSLQNHGYNNGEGTTVIPVFGVDATDSARAAIDAGTMTGTVKQDAEGMAKVTALLAQNLLAGKAPVTDIPAAYEPVGTWRVNIPYSPYQR
ncbi:MAG: substrate-binding domain-containing protein [Erysipelotrichaceae bacterium]|nr:substrate-binding domain-containing protein [Erysipelotrichaceae bacterium]